MAYSDDLRNLRDRYRDCLSGVHNTANYLSSSIKTLRNLSNTQDSCYKVEDVDDGSNYLEYLIEQEDDIYSFLVDSVIPSTYDIIQDLNWQIQDAIIQEQVGV